MERWPDLLQIFLLPFVAYPARRDMQSPSPIKGKGLVAVNPIIRWNAWVSKLGSIEIRHIYCSFLDRSKFNYIRPVKLRLCT